MGLIGKWMKPWLRFPSRVGDLRLRATTLRLHLLPFPGAKTTTTARHQRETNHEPKQEEHQKPKQVLLAAARRLDNCSRFHQADLLAIRPAQAKEPQHATQTWSCLGLLSVRSHGCSSELPWSLVVYVKGPGGRIGEASCGSAPAACRGTRLHGHITKRDAARRTSQLKHH